MSNIRPISPPTLGWIAGVAGVAIMALWPHTAAQNPQAAHAALPVRAIVVAAPDASASDSADYAATLHRDREAQMAFRLAGRITAFPAHAGDHLARGGLIAAIEPQSFAAAAARTAADEQRAARTAERYDALAREGAVPGAQARDSGDELAAARAAHAAARYDLASTRLEMPFAGVILARKGELGETVAPGQVLVSVADLAAPMIATAQVPADIAATLRRGQAGRVILAGRAALVGHILRIAAGADTHSGTVSVDLAIAGANGLASGTPASVSFALAKPNAAAVEIPAEALLEAEGEHASVYTIDAQGHARRQPVRFMGLNDRAARISGLAPGARVITAGAGFVSDGALVEVTP